MAERIEFKTLEMNPCIINPGDPWPHCLPDYRRDFERPGCTLVGWLLSFMQEPAGLFESWEVFWFAKRKKRQFYTRWTGFKQKRLSEEEMARLPPDYEPGDKIGQHKVIERLHNPDSAFSVIIRPDLLPPLNIPLSKKLNERCGTIYKKNYSAFTFKEFLTLIIDWGLKEAELRIEAQEEMKNG